MSESTERAAMKLMVDTSLETGLITFCEKLGLSKELINQLSNGYPENSAFLNESLDCIRTLIEVFKDGDEAILELLQEHTNYDHERLARAVKTFQRYSQSAAKE